MPIDLLADRETKAAPIDLLAEFDKPKDHMDIARERIAQQYPGMPNWLQEGILSMIDSEPHPALNTAGNIAEHINRIVQGTGLPAASRGALSGLTAPGRFAADAANFGIQMTGREPSKFLEKIGAPLPTSPRGATPRIPFTNIEIPLAPSAEIVGDIGGSAVSGGPIFKTLMKGAEAARIPGLISKPIAGAITGASLSPENPMTGAAVGSVLPAATKVSKTISEDLPLVWNTLTTEQKPLEAFNKMLKGHDTLDYQSKALYKEANRLANTKDLKPIKIQDKILDVAEKHLEPDADYLNLIKKAKDGDYDALHKVQSDMGKKATSIYSNPNSNYADREKADALVKARNLLNDQMQERIIQQGHHDLAAIRGQASKLYADKMQTYFNKNLKPTVRNIFTEGKRLRPGQTDLDLLKPFMERSDAMEALLGQHPEMREEVELARAKQAAINKLRPFMKAAKATGLGGGVLKIGELLKDFL